MAGEDIRDVLGVSKDTQQPPPHETDDVPAFPAKADKQEKSDNVAEEQPESAQGEQNDDTQPQPDESSDKPKGEPNRFRFKDEEDRAIAQLAKAKGVSLREAARLYESMPAPADKPKGGKPAETAGEPPAEIAAIEEQIEQLGATLKELGTRRASAAEEFDQAKRDEIQDQIDAVRGQITELKFDRKLVQRDHESRYRRTAEASRDAVFEKFEALARPKSLERRAFDAFVHDVRADQKRAGIFDDPRWPEKLADEFAAEVGLEPAQGKGTPAQEGKKAPPAKAAPKPAAIQQVPGAKLLDGADGSTPSASRPKLTMEQAKARLRQMSKEEREAVLNLTLK